MAGRRSYRVMISETEDSTIQFGKELALKLKRGSVLALHGDLGSGKTTLVKGIVEALTQEPCDNVQSPTFTYLNLYEAEEFPLYHFDLYRLKSTKSFVDLGFLDFFDDNGICLIEWPDRIATLLPEGTLHVKLTHLAEGGRRIDVHES